MTGAIPAFFGIIPMYYTSQMGADGGNNMQFSRLIPMGSELVPIMLYSFAFAFFDFLPIFSLGSFDVIFYIFSCNVQAFGNKFFRRFKGSKTSGIVNFGIRIFTVGNPV